MNIMYTLDMTENEVTVLRYGTKHADTRTVVGSWQAWQSQLPGLPSNPNTEPTERVEDDLIDVANRRYQGATLLVTSGAGTVAEVLSLLWHPKVVNGELVCKAFIVTDQPPTRHGLCPVCDQYGDLVERVDASGIRGWAHPEHDDLDVVFA